MFLEVKFSMYLNRLVFVMQRKMAKLFTYSGDSDQMPHSASDLDLHCLPNVLFGASRL